MKKITSFWYQHTCALWLHHFIVTLQWYICTIYANKSLSNSYFDIFCNTFVTIQKTMITKLTRKNSWEFIFYNKLLYFMKTICLYHIWSYKNTNLLNVCVVLFVLHILSSISSFNLRTYKKWRNSILLSSSNLLLCIYYLTFKIQKFRTSKISPLRWKPNIIHSSRKS